MKKYIYLIAIAICSTTLTGCYDGEMVDSGAMVSKMTTLSPEYENNEIILRGEAGKYSECLYFQLSKNEDFSDSHTVSAYGHYEEKLRQATINKWEYIGTWYYKLIASRGNDTYDVSNVETFTVDNPLQMLQPEDVTWKQATLRAVTSVNPVESGNARRSYFYVTGVNGYYYKNIYVSDYTKVGDSWEYTATITGLDYSTEYRVVFVQEFYNTTVTSEPIIFSTTPRTTAPLSISYINGEVPDENGINHRITDNLNVLVYDYQVGYVTKEPLLAVYDETLGGYKWAEGSSYSLIDGHSYAVAIFKATGTKWSSNDSYVGSVYYNESYAYGKEQYPIYFGTCEKLTIDNPAIKANLYVKTAQIRIKYPSIWGETTFTLMDDKKNLPSNAYGLDGPFMYGPTNFTSEYMGLGNVKVSSDTYKEYLFNMWAGNYITKNLKIKIRNGVNEYVIPCPINLSTSAGKQYTFEFEGFSISDVTVSGWTVKEDGDVIVIKSQK